MSTDVSANGSGSDQPRRRPSWYVPPKPIPEEYDGPSGRDLLVQLADLIDPADLPDDLQRNVRAHLDRLLLSDKSHSS